MKSAREEELEHVIERAVSLCNACESVIKCENVFLLSARLNLLAARMANFKRTYAETIFERTYSETTKDDES